MNCTDQARKIPTVQTNKGMRSTTTATNITSTTPSSYTPNSASDPQARQICCISHIDFPIAVAAEAPEQSVIAVVTGTEGPAYRAVGSAMVVRNDRILAGSLSSGCIEADVVLHAMEALTNREGRTIRYGSGSPYVDIRLPCGGGLDITLIPAPQLLLLSAVQRKLVSREHVDLTVWTEEGRISLAGEMPSTNDVVSLRVLPDIAYYVFGKGPEAVTFARISQAAGYVTRLFSPDEETLEQAGVPSTRLSSPTIPQDLVADQRSAIVLFFHDHDWEPPILEAALTTDAFYIGAQGSARAREVRNCALRANGLGEDEIARIRGPVGLIRSTRDPRSLAISVLAEVLHVGQGERTLQARRL